jgi:hypothetical protein
MKITVPENRIFTPAFFCSVIIQFCSFLKYQSLVKLFSSVFDLIYSKIFKHELFAIHKNGIVIECAGMFSGQLLLKLDRDIRSISVLVLAFNPDLIFASHIFYQLIQTKFEQCMWCLILLCIIKQMMGMQNTDCVPIVHW